MGSRGSSGPSLSDSSGKDVNIVNEMDVWSYRHNPDNEPFVDAINSGARRIHEDFPGMMDAVENVSASELSGADKMGVLGYYSELDKTVAINENYTDIDKMNQVYDHSVSEGYHPGRGDKSGTEAVTLHEMGHALTAYVAKQMGVPNLDAAAKRIVNAAYKASNGRGGTKAWAGKISGYAQDSYAECIAEAVADYYCNGANASAQSRAIMQELFKYR